MSTQEIANLALWGLQILLAVGFLGAGVNHAFRFEQFASQPRMGWANAVGSSNMRIIGLLEIAGALGLILPAATGILPWTTLVAAVCLALLMGFAWAFHARRGEPIVPNLLLGGLALVLVAGRIFIAPF